METLRSESGSNETLGHSNSTLPEMDLERFLRDYKAGVRYTLDESGQIVCGSIDRLAEAQYGTAHDRQ